MKKMHLEMSLVLVIVGTAKHSDPGIFFTVRIKADVPRSVLLKMLGCEVPL